MRHGPQNANHGRAGGGASHCCGPAGMVRVRHMASGRLLRRVIVWLPLSQMPTTAPVLRKRRVVEKGYDEKRSFPARGRGAARPVRSLTETIARGGRLHVVYHPDPAVPPGGPPSFLLRVPAIPGGACPQSSAAQASKKRERGPSTGVGKVS